MRYTFYGPPMHPSPPAGSTKDAYPHKRSVAWRVPVCALPNRLAGEISTEPVMKLPVCELPTAAMKRGRGPRFRCTSNFPVDQVHRRNKAVVTELSVRARMNARQRGVATSAPHPH